MRESIEEAAQYVLAHYKELGIAPDWRENFDVAVLATIMGKVLGVGGIQAKLLAAIEAGVKTVILPEENRQDVRHLPD